MNYDNLKREYIKGWNTYYNDSVTAYTYMPYGLMLSLGFKEYSKGRHLTRALIGRFNDYDDTEKIVPSYHAPDASYTELTLKWMRAEYRVETALDGDDIVILVTPLPSENKLRQVLTAEASVCWNREGYVTKDGDSLTAVLPDKTVNIYHTGKSVNEMHTSCISKYICAEIDGAVGVCTGKKRTLGEITDIVRRKRENYISHIRSLTNNDGEKAEVYKAMQSAIAWNTIYDPQKERVITPVSRLWNKDSGGYVIFCWDSYFAALMASLDDKNLAYAVAVEITREKTKDGFVPNGAFATGRASLDRSQPPVGSFCVNEIYKKYREKWFLEEVFDDLTSWNDWWFKNRQLSEGLFAWGSDDYEQTNERLSEDKHAHTHQGAAYESGLDNSPMYDNVPFNEERNMLDLADVGLTSLVLLDCRNLAEIADALGRDEIKIKLLERAAVIEESMMSLWDEKSGFFLNRFTDGSFSDVKSPTCFYALFNKRVTEDMVSRMLSEHFYNENEFWGEYILPSVAKDHPSFADQSYWRGRIWAPMNLLVYFALKERESCAGAARDLAEKSKNLMMKEWTRCGHIHENYNAVTGEGCDVGNSDKFYSWGGLLGCIYLYEKSVG